MKMNGIHPIRKQDIDDVLKLSAFAFQYELTEQSLAKQRSAMKLQEHWGYYIEGQLAAKLRIIPMELYLHGQSFDMGGIASVASWPEHRRQGMVSKLLTASLTEMRRLGQSISVLHPFSFAFYRKYGWELNTQYKQYTIENHQLSRFDHATGFVERMNHPRNEWQVLEDVYSQYVLLYNGMVRRDHSRWQHNVLANQQIVAIVYYNEERQPQGYLLYHIEKREMIIKEMLFLNESARTALWNVICNHDSMVERVSLVAPVNDALPSLLPEPRIEQVIKPYSMARIVDVERFIAQFPFAFPTEDVELIVKIEDGQADWNNGCFNIRISLDGKLKVEKLAPSQSTPTDALLSDNDAWLSCDIQTFTAMMTGGMRPLDLYKFGRLKGELKAVKLWEQLLPEREVYLLDFF